MAKTVTVKGWVMMTPRQMDRRSFGRTRDDCYDAFKCALGVDPTGDTLKDLMARSDWRPVRATLTYEAPDNGG